MCSIGFSFLREAAPGGKADSSHGLGGMEDASEIDGFNQGIGRSHPTALLFSGVHCLADPLRKL
jgi:hypothetical protein